MKKIIITPDYAYIHLHKNLYSEQAIINAQKDFNELISISKKDYMNYTTIKITPRTKDFDTKTLTNEFLNFIIAHEFHIISQENES